jgi:hypothetical protein
MTGVEIAFAATAVAAAAASAVGAYSTANANKAAYRYQEDINAQNATLLDKQGRDAIERGRQAADINNRKVAAARARARVGLASTGFDVNTGSALDTQTDISTLGAMDTEIIKQNAAREAYQLSIGALGSRQQGAMAGAAASGISPAFNTGVSLLGGAASLSDQWYRYKASAPAGIGQS